MKFFLCTLVALLLAFTVGMCSAWAAGHPPGDAQTSLMPFAKFISETPQAVAAPQAPIPPDRFTGTHCWRRRAACSAFAPGHRRPFRARSSLPPGLAKPI